MNRLQIMLIACIAAITVVAGVAILRIKPAPAESHHDDHEGHGEHEEHEDAAQEEWTRGPHRGRLLGEKPFQIVGRVSLPEEALQSSGITIESVGPAVLRSTLSLNGKVIPNEDQMTNVRARYSGVIKEMRKRLGDKVTKGELLAVIESNESLQPYDVRAQISGTVIEKKASLGESIADNEAIYTVADLATVWVDMNVYRRDFARLRVGQDLEIDAEDGLDPVRTRIAYISPFGTENTQTMLARAVLDNSKGLWRPGLFVKAEVTLEKRTVPLVVKSDALQTFRDWDVVFVQDGNLFEVVPLELGQRDGEWVEVLEGIKAGTRYASGNSYLLKAELGKSGATHDH